MTRLFSSRGGTGTNAPVEEMCDVEANRYHTTNTSKIRKIYDDGFENESRISFWDHELGDTRRLLAKEWGKTTLILCICILAILSIFWGAFLHVDENLSVLNVWVVDFDSQDQGTGGQDAPFVGPTIVETALEITQSPGFHITYESIPASRFAGTMAVREAIYDEHAWAAVIINPGASSQLRNAIAISNSSYDPEKACQLVYVSARDQTALSSYVVPALQNLQTKAVAAVGKAWGRELFSNSSTNLHALSVVPQAVSPAIGFTVFDLRPFGPPQVIPTVTVGLIYLIIVAFFSYSFFMPTHAHLVITTGGHRKPHFYHVVVWRYCSTLGAYFFLSLAYSLVSLAFQVPFSEPPASHVEVAAHANAYGRASFVVFWMVNFIGMCALGFACENVAMIVGQPYTAIWLIFWVISNVCTAFYPVVLAPGLYRYGYAFPLHSIVEASRIILFDIKSEMGLYIGILVAWWAVNTTLFPFCAWYLRHTKK